ncbi:hypothetical protein EDF67_103258 [Sphingobacterium sp. JUb78]|nr:hypothetical protein [Sphingobacterium kitahiroshimense]TCR11845.1 hypothetical protein EDF67_103258 [Sphingobacterium sp. JUb78]
MKILLIYLKYSFPKKFLTNKSEEHELKYIRKESRSLRQFITFPKLKNPSRRLRGFFNFLIKMKYFYSFINEVELVDA